MLVMLCPVHPVYRNFKLKNLKKLGPQNVVMLVILVMFDFSWYILNLGLSERSNVSNVSNVILILIHNFWTWGSLNVIMLVIQG